MRPYKGYSWVSTATESCAVFRRSHIEHLRSGAGCAHMELCRWAVPGYEAHASGDDV